MHLDFTEICDYTGTVVHAVLLSTTECKGVSGPNLSLVTDTDMGLQR